MKTLFQSQRTESEEWEQLCVWNTRIGVVVKRVNESGVRRGLNEREGESVRHGIPQSREVAISE